MAKMWEHLDVETIKDLIPEIRDKLEHVALDRYEGGYKQLVIPRDKWDSVGVPFLFACHSRMWREGKPDRAAPWPYKKRWTGSTRTLVEGVAGAAGDVVGLDGLRQQLTGLLYRNHLAIRPSPNAKSFWVAEWRTPTEFITTYRSPLSIRERADVEKQARKAETASAPVVVDYSIKAIPVPDPLTPDSAAEYLRKVADCFRKLQTAYQQQIDRVAELETELETLQANPWDWFRDVTEMLP